MPRCKGFWRFSTGGLNEPVTHSVGYAFLVYHIFGACQTESNTRSFFIDDAIGISTYGGSGFCTPVRIMMAEANGIRTHGLNLAGSLFGTGSIVEGNLAVCATFSGLGIITVGTDGQGGTQSGPFFMGVFNGFLTSRLNADGSYYLLRGNFLSRDRTNRSGKFSAKVQACYPATEER
jgi:hypothetical protein